MVIRIISESKIKDLTVISFVEEYIKRLVPYISVELKEFNVTDKGYKKYLKSFRDDDIIIALDSLGKHYDSKLFAEYISDLRFKAVRSVNFIIGSADGLSDIVKDYIKGYLSLSDMTLSYRVSIMVLAEQIYRAVMIINNHPYHK